MRSFCGGSQSKFYGGGDEVIKVMSVMSVMGPKYSASSIQTCNLRDAIVSSMIVNSGGLSHSKVTFMADKGGILASVHMRKGNGTLLHLIDQEMSKENRSAICHQILRDVGSSLTSLHGMGVVHCDIKPENIVYYKEDEVGLN